MNSKIGKLQQYFGCFAVAMLATLLSGCGDGKTEFTGTVSFNGAPVELGYVEFTPVDGDGGIVGVKIEGGEFKLRTSPGTKKASVRAKLKVGEKPPTARIPMAEPIYHNYIPAEFNNQTKLTVEFKDSDPNVVLALEGEKVEYKSAPLPAGRKDTY